MKDIANAMRKSNRRGVARFLLWTAAGLIVVLVSVWVYRQLDASALSYDVVMTPPSIPADGSSSALLEIKVTSRFGHELGVGALPSAPRVAIVEGGDLVRVVPLGDSLRFRLVGGFNTGTVVIRITIAGLPAPLEARLELLASLADGNRNGYPDLMDLTSESDRTAFRRWFTTIALAQLTHLDDAWHDRDCAGLVRYCYREALKRHDSAWLHQRRWLVAGGIADVGKYNYPHVPLVGTRVFNAGQRRDDDSLRVASVSDHHRRARESLPFHAFAEAARLKDNSMSMHSRVPSDALPGDILIYLNDTESQWPYHMMIYLGGGVAIYHTGPDGSSPGRVKKLSLQELASHPNARWHPVEQNPYFLGFYRWRILL